MHSTCQVNSPVSIACHRHYIKKTFEPPSGFPSRTSEAVHDTAHGVLIRYLDQVVHVAVRSNSVPQLKALLAILFQSFHSRGHTPGQGKEIGSDIAGKAGFVSAQAQRRQGGIREDAELSHRRDAVPVEARPLPSLVIRVNRAKSLLGRKTPVVSTTSAKSPQNPINDSRRGLLR
jgi:hypothetical protein